MIHDDSSYYDIGYYLPDLEADGAYHQITVKVNRPSLVVSTRRGYYAPIPFAGLSRAQKRQWLYRSLLEDQPLGEIELISRSSAFFNPPSADITIRIAVRGRWWARKTDENEQHWTMLVGVLQDEHGNVLSSFENTNFWHSKDEEPENGDFDRREAAYNVLTRLKPGRYQLKIAVADLYSGIAGSTVLFFQVPQQVSQTVVTSSLVLSKTSRANGQKNGDMNDSPVVQIEESKDSVTLDPLRIDDRTVIPSVDCIFSKRNPLTIFSRFYSRDDEFPNGWVVSASLRDSTNRRSIANAPAEILKPTPGIPGIPVIHTFDLAKLNVPDGKYVAELTFTRLGQKEPVRIGAQFMIGSAKE